MINTVLGVCVVVVSILGMSIGVLLGRKPISGSCGGEPGRCDVCGVDKC